MDQLVPSEAKFVVVPGNPFDTTADDLAPMIEELNNEGHAEVRIRAERGYGVTFIEVVIVYIAMKALDATVDRIFEKLLDKVEGAGTQWWKRRRIGRNRPASVLICDEEGNVLRSLDYTPDADDPVGKDAAQVEKRLPMPPSD